MENDSKVEDIKPEITNTKSRHRKVGKSARKKSCKEIYRYLTKKYFPSYAKVKPSLTEDVDDEKQDVDGDDEVPSSVTHLRRRGYRKPKTYFYIGGGNGAHLVEENLVALGWERISDKSREDFKLKWCEIKSHNNYHSFREGEQLCYQIPNNKLLTTKIGLLNSLQEYDRVMNKVKKGKPRILKYQEFFPETYRLDLKDDRELFFERYVDDEIWISKPTSMNQGKGIYLIRCKEDIVRLQEKIAELTEDAQASRKLPFKVPMARIVQRYVENPLLIDGRKFDVRNYLLIACTNPLVVFYGDGYCRLTCMPYDHHSTDLTGHLTNQFMQKKNPLYEEVKEDTVWSMDRFNDYVNENFMIKHGLPEDWVHTVLKRRCQQIMLHCFQAVRHKLECRLGFFDLFGCDFIIDDTFKVFLLEMNCNPALHTNCETLRDLMPDVVGETLKLALEIFDKSLKRERILPLTAQKHFTLLYNGDIIEAAERRERLQSAAEARRRARSAQRRKRFVPGQFVYKRSSQSTTSSTTSSSTTTTSTTNAQCSTSCSSLAQPTSTTASNQSNMSGSSDTVLTPSCSAITTFPSTSRTNNIQTNLRNFTLPSSTVTALTTSSQQRVTKSKSTPNVSLKPFYAGGTVASRPYSAPKFNRKYAQVESRVISHNTLYTMESSKRDNINNAALNAASNSKVANYVQKVRSVLLTPKREEVNGEKENDPEVSIDEEIMGEIQDEIEAMERENIFEQIMEEDEMETDDEDQDVEDENEMEMMESSPSPEVMRRLSARLPPSYHSTASSGSNFVTVNGSSNWSKYPQPMQVIQKKITRIAALSVKGNIELPPPSLIQSYNTPRVTVEQSTKAQYRTPTTVRVRQSLPPTTCTLEIGPKARRGLIAVSTSGKHASPLSNEMYTSNRKLSNTARLKLINTSHSNSAADEQSDAVPSSTLLYLATAHQSHVGAINEQQELRAIYPSVTFPLAGSLMHGSLPPQHPSHQTSLLPMKYVQVNNSKNKTDSSTQTIRQSRALFPGEEKVIWRLRSRASDGGNRLSTDGTSSPVSPKETKGQKMLLKIPIVSQSPSLISPRRVVDPLTNRRLSVVAAQKKAAPNVTASGTSTNAGKQFQTSETKDANNLSNEIDLNSIASSQLASNASLLPEKPTALSKVVAIATAVPTRYRSSESKTKSSSNFSEELTLLTAG